MLIKKIFWTPQFLRFGLIGVANTIIHGLLLTGFVELLLFNVIISNLMAFLIANLASYSMNSYITFKVPISLILYCRFLLASLFSLALTLLIAWLMNYCGFHYLQGFLVIIFIVPALSFLAMKLWAFSVN